MLIDWFTVGAQVINFLVLVWLLKRYLYQPILKAIDVREQRIAAELANASNKQAAADAARDEFQARNARFDADRDALLAKATADAATEQKRLLAEARDAGDALRARQRAALQTERANLGESIARLTGREVLTVARRTLADLADADLEARMAGVFVRRLREMTPDAAAVLAEALRSAAGPACLRSTFELGDDAKAAIRQGLDTLVGGPVAVAFEIAPDQLCGIELRVGGHKLAWRIDDYLAGLSDKLDTLLEEQAARPAATDTASPAGSRATDPAVPPAGQPAPVVPAKNR